MSRKPCHCCGGTGVENNHVKTGHELKTLRRLANMRLKEMADGLGISVSLLCDLEHGRRHWTQDRIEKYKEIVSQ